MRIKDSPLWLIVATYFSLELLYSRSDNGGWGTAVRERQRESWESSDNQNTKLTVSAPPPQQYMTGSDLDIEVVRLQTRHTGPTPPNPETETIIMEYLFVPLLYYLLPRHLKTLNRNIFRRFQYILYNKLRPRFFISLSLFGFIRLVNIMMCVDDVDGNQWKQLPDLLSTNERWEATPLPATEHLTASNNVETTTRHWLGYGGGIWAGGGGVWGQ